MDKTFTKIEIIKFIKTALMKSILKLVKLQFGGEMFVKAKASRRFSNIFAN